MPKRKRTTLISKELQRTLDRTGVTRLRAEGRKPAAVPFPDLSVPTEGVAPTSDKIFATGSKVKEVVATNHIVSHFHKQGYQVVSKSDLLYVGGKKP